MEGRHWEIERTVNISVKELSTDVDDKGERVEGK